MSYSATTPPRDADSMKGESNAYALSLPPPLSLSLSLSLSPLSLSLSLATHLSNCFPRSSGLLASFGRVHLRPRLSPLPGGDASFTTSSHPCHTSGANRNSISRRVVGGGGPSGRRSPTRHHDQNQLHRALSCGRLLFRVYSNTIPPTMNPTRQTQTRKAHPSVEALARAGGRIGRTGRRVWPRLAKASGRVALAGAEHHEGARAKANQLNSPDSCGMQVLKVSRRVASSDRWRASWDADPSATVRRPTRTAPGPVASSDRRTRRTAGRTPRSRPRRCSRRSDRLRCARTSLNAVLARCTARSCQTCIGAHADAHRAARFIRSPPNRSPPKMDSSSFEMT